jgi:uncharacterized protein YlxW (UPF0749 family)
MPEVGKVYWLREKQEFAVRGRTVGQWIKHEKAVRVKSIRAGKITVKNAFGNSSVTKVIPILEIGSKFIFDSYVKPSKQSSEEKNIETTDKILNDAKLKALKEKQKQLRKELSAVEKQIDKLTELRKPVDRAGKNSGGYAELAAYILKDVKKSK